MDGFYETGQGNMHATIWEQRDRYLANSPIFLFDRIQTPVLMGQGDQGGRLEPADVVFEALKRLGKSVEAPSRLPGPTYGPEARHRRGNPLWT